MKPTERFSDRADDYAKWRPSYPPEVVDTMGLAPGALVADIGAGTGISSELFLRRGYRVVAVEPNAAMREKAERALTAYPDFRATTGTAEATGFQDESVDAVFCAQAFHWFDAKRARDEFLRIVKPSSVIGICWNDRRRDGSAFLHGLESLFMRHSADYRERIHPRTVAAMASVERTFAPRRVDVAILPNAQTFDWDGLLGRVRSASYVPLEGCPEHETFFDGLRALFDAESTGGFVRIEYECRLYRVCCAAWF